MRGAVERHVLEHVREAALVVVFEHRAGLDRQSQQDAPFRPGVPADVVGEAVRQPADGDRLVHGQDAVERRQRVLGSQVLPGVRGAGHAASRRPRTGQNRDGLDRAADERRTSHDW